MWGTHPPVRNGAEAPADTAADDAPVRALRRSAGGGGRAQRPRRIWEGFVELEEEAYDAYVLAYPSVFGWCFGWLAYKVFLSSRCLSVAWWFRPSSLVDSWEGFPAAGIRRIRSTCNTLTVAELGTSL